MKKVGNSDVTVIIPTYNEGEGIGPTLKEIKEVLEDPTYLVIDRNSIDGTVEIAKNMGALVVMQNGQGKGHAIAQALEHVNSETHYVIFIDADFTYPAGYISKMIGVLEEDQKVGMVTGNRFDDRFDFKKAFSNVYYLGNRFLALTQYLLNGIRLRDPLTGLRVVRWKILKNWKPKSKGFDIEVELNQLVERKGYSIMEIPIHYRRRLGDKKLKLRHGFTILKRILVDSFRI